MPPDGRRREALLVFARTPVAGEVKTRLSPAISLDDAARLYEAFLRDALHAYASLEADLFLFLSGPTERLPRGIVPANVEVAPQRGRSLGKRMRNAFASTFAKGYERVVLIGSDHPTLPSAFVGEAFRRLEEPFSLVLGPAEDGGYYLVGMNELYPELFEGVRYSRSTVWAETLERCAAVDAALTILPAWFDVDTPESLARLATELSDDTGISAPCTRAVLAELKDRPG